MMDPYEKIKSSAIEAMLSNFESRKSHAPGDSEIEKIFYMALVSYVEDWQVCSYSAVRRWVADPDREGMHELWIKPQCEIGKYRVDFLIAAYDFGSTELTEKGEWVYDHAKWRKLIVECDGHDFHERTKEQAAKDRSRDRALTLQGYTVFRFTGSEIWRDPCACARQTVDWCSGP